jgi:TldD protein
MAERDLFATIEFLKAGGEELLAQFARSRRGVRYADLRFEAVFRRSASATNGEPRHGGESESAGFGVSVHVGRSGAIGHGYCGGEVGRLARDSRKLATAIRAALNRAFERARLNAREKSATLKHLGARARMLADGGFAPRAPIRREIAAVFRHDPRSLSPDAPKQLTLDASMAVRGLGREIAFNTVAAMSELRQEIFVSTEGSLIAQGFAFSEGDCYVVAQASAGGHQEIFDTIGQQRGFEALAEGYRDELLPNPDLRTFAVELAKEARELACAPILKPPEREVTVVTDPHFNALLAHEVVGHPSEADRALKMEAAYAGRSWFLRSIDDTEIGRTVGSPLVSACSDPTLYGYGHYAFDHEGTPGRRVMHIDRGVFSGFINSRATAAVLGVEPNGSARASEVYYVPLVRMSNTFFLPGESKPEKIIGEVERGYYVVAHAIPSIAESRENFRISARRVYEIENGRIGRLYRSGSVLADSKRFFMNVDAVGNDLRLVAIPNCGKGQPMQVKRMSNGGPTMRSRARLEGG